MSSTSNLIIVMVGAHGSGKSTLGRRLAQALSIPFEPELGELMRRKALQRSPQAHAACSQPAFDECLFQAELERDHHLRLSSNACVVETWHPGNLAYAEKRSPHIVAQFLPTVRETCMQLQGRVWVQPLSISRETLRQRQHEPGPAEEAEGEAFTQFLLEVGESAPRWAISLGLEVLPTLCTDQLDPDACVERILERLAPLLTVKATP
ncbi:MAG: AAA family ATPase [Myxococcota bacterium]